MIIFAVIVPVATVIVWYGQRLYDLELNAALSLKRQSNELLRNHIASEVTRHKTLLENKGGRLSLLVDKPINPKNLKQIYTLLRLIVEREPAIHEAMILSRQGGVIADVDSGMGILGDRFLSPEELQSVATRVGFDKPDDIPEVVIPSLGRIYIGSPKYHDNHTFVFSLAVPIGAPVKAVLVSFIDVDKLWLTGVHKKDDITTEKTRDYMLDRRGSLLTTLEDSNFLPGDLLSHIEITRQALIGGEWPINKTFNGVMGNVVFGTLTEVPSINWTLVSEVDATSITEPIWQSLFNIIFVTLLGVVVFILVVVYLAGKTLKPIQATCDAFDQVAKGDFQLTMKPNVIHELNALSSGFNNMAAALQQAEEALRESAARYRSLVENIDLGINLIDSDHNIVMVNSAQGRKFNKITREIVGKKCFREFEKRDVVCPHCPGIRVMATGQPEEVETEAVRDDGSRFAVKIHAFPIEGEDGAARGFIEVVEDITERKRAEDQLNSYRKELESTNKQLEEAIGNANQMAGESEAANIAKSEFLANMSHEIRTPMNGVLGFSDMLLDTDLEADQRDYAETIKRSGEGLLSLINDILDFSKIEAGQLDFEEVEFDPELLAYDVCDLIRPNIGFRPLEILCHIGDNLPSLVKGDPTRFRQVLTNLMGNAPKFTDAGEIELSLDVEEEKDGRVKLHAKIRDTGIGIPPDKLSTIFEPFQQADNSTTRMYGGTGLGLSICKKISELMEGDVWAESEINKGSVFHFTAWLGKAEYAEALRFTPKSLTGKKVFIVDDNETNLEILTHNLGLIGMDVVALNNGEKVSPTLQEAQEDDNPFDLGICGIQMPGMSGYEVAKQIRDSESRFKNIPLIAVSSLMERDAKKCEEAGFDGFLSKPVNRKKLYQMLEGIFGEKKDKSEKVGHKIRTQYSVREEMKHSLRILLAEDNPVNQKLAKMMLTKAGYQVEVANDGREAVGKYTASPDNFDVILMDIQMPEMDGLEATQAIREKGFCTIPIIALTANAMKSDRETCLEAGMDDYITKPIKREIVFEILEKWILNKEEARISADSKKISPKKELEF